MIFVLDASALLALIHAETGGEMVNSLLTEKNNTCYMHAVNLCEVYYDLVRRAGASRARDVVNQIAKGGVSVQYDLDTDFWQQAGDIKAHLKRVSLADCFCVTLANKLGADVVTGDRHEFEALVNAQVCRATFIR